MILFLSKNNLGKELQYIICFWEVWGKLINVICILLEKKIIKIQIVVWGYWTETELSAYFQAFLYVELI